MGEFFYCIALFSSYLVTLYNTDASDVQYGVLIHSLRCSIDRLLIYLYMFIKNFCNLHCNFLYLTLFYCNWNVAYIHPFIMYCSHKKLQLDMQTIKFTKKLLNIHINATTDIQNNKMIKHKWGKG